MQMMTWTLARLGSRFSLRFEPQYRRVRHSALGRFFDQPMDLMVGLIEPDGTECVLPFSKRGVPLQHIEQFERLNSITFRGYSPRYQLRFELNFHSVFYPQDQRLCTIPAFYLEMRVSPAAQFAGPPPLGPTPDRVRLLIRLDRPDTKVVASAGLSSDPGSEGTDNAQMDLIYANATTPTDADQPQTPPDQQSGATTQVHERIVSLNPGCDVDADGKGLTLDLPVTEAGSGVKWRLVWGAHCDQPIPTTAWGLNHRHIRFKYLEQWRNLDALMHDAIRMRDDHLAHSRRLEKLIEQAPLTMAQRHLLNQSFQSFLSDTLWCELDNGHPWYSVWENCHRCHCSIEVGYYSSIVYLAVWPELLAIQLAQWAEQKIPHEASGGAYLGDGDPGGRESPSDHGPQLVNSCYYLLMLQAYSHWTGNLSTAQDHMDLVQQLACYLIWSVQHPMGAFATKPDTAIDGIHGSIHDGHQKTSLKVKRLAALQAAGDLLNLGNRHHELASRCIRLAETEAQEIDTHVWLGDHYGLCTDQPSTGVAEPWPGLAAPAVPEPDGCDAYTIDTGDGLLLPAMTAQPTLLDIHHLQADLANASRESLAAYGCGANSSEIENIWISKNLWRDHLALYLHCGHPAWDQRYWDLQVVSNTDQQSFGYCDTYTGHDVASSVRGVASFGFLLACPRLVIDRLAPGGARISVEPNRHFAKRWPLLPLADWKAGRIPVCVVDATGRVSIESQSDPVIIHDGQTNASPTIG